METNIKKKLAKNWFKILQDMVCFEIEEIEKSKKKFISSHWEKNKKKDEGGGEYRILENGKVFEKVGVNFSEVYGKFSKEFRKKIPGTNSDPSFWASGISIVMHMKNPHVPTMHFNTRYIYTTFGWFGGGIDITPCINDPKEKKWFHNELKKHAVDIIKIIIRNTKNGVMNIFICLTEKKLEALVEFFLIIKKKIGRKILYS